MSKGLFPTSRVDDPSATFPMDNKQAITAFPQSLTEFEKSEILDFEQIYTIGAKGVKKTQGLKDNKDCNHNYDDKEGDYKVVMGDHLGYRWETKEFLGQGSFGIAIKCFDHKEKRDVAIKIIKNKQKYLY